MACGWGVVWRIFFCPCTVRRWRLPRWSVVTSTCVGADLRVCPVLPRCLPYFAVPFAPFCRAVCPHSPRYSQYAALRCAGRTSLHGVVAANVANVVAQGADTQVCPYTHVGMMTDRWGDRIGGVGGVAGNAPTIATWCCKMRCRGGRHRRLCPHSPCRLPPFCDDRHRRRGVACNAHSPPPTAHFHSPRYSSVHGTTLAVAPMVGRHIHVRNVGADLRVCPFRRAVCPILLRCLPHFAAMFAIFRRAVCPILLRCLPYFAVPFAPFCRAVCPILLRCLPYFAVPFAPFCRDVCPHSPRYSQYAALRCAGRTSLHRGQTRRSAPTYVGMMADRWGDRIGGVAGNAPTIATWCCKIRYLGGRHRRLCPHFALLLEFPWQNRKNFLHLYLPN